MINLSARLKISHNLTIIWFNYAGGVKTKYIIEKTKKTWCVQHSRFCFQFAIAIESSWLNKLRLRLRLWLWPDANLNWIGQQANRQKQQNTTTIAKMLLKSRTKQTS